MLSIPGNVISNTNRIISTNTVAAFPRGSEECRLSCPCGMHNNAACLLRLLCCANEFVWRLEHCPALQTNRISDVFWNCVGAQFRRCLSSFEHSTVWRRATRSGRILYYWIIDIVVNLKKNIQACLHKCHAYWVQFFISLNSSNTSITKFSRSRISGLSAVPLNTAVFSKHILVLICFF